MDKLREYIQDELIRELLFEFEADQLISFHMTKMDNIDKDGIYYEGRTKDGKKIEVRFGANTSEPFANGDYDVTFYVDNSPYEVVNSGTPFSTMASIMKVIEDFCEKVRPKALVWVSTKTSKDDQYKPGQRDLLYKRFLSKQVPAGYKFIEGGWGGGILERINQNEPHYVWPGARPYLAPPKEKIKDPFADFKFDYNDPEMIKEKVSKNTETDYFSSDNHKGDEYEFKDLGYTAVYTFLNSKQQSYWSILELEPESGQNYEIGMLWWDGDLEVYNNKTGKWDTHKDFGTDLKQAARFIWLNRQQQSEPMQATSIAEEETIAPHELPEKNKEAVATFPDLDGMYVKMLYNEPHDKKYRAYSFFFPGYEEKNKRLGILFYPEMELRYSNKKQESSKEGWVSVLIPHLVLRNKQPDLRNVARYLYIMKQT